MSAGADPFDGEEAARLSLADFMVEENAAAAAAKYAAKLAAGHQTAVFLSCWRKQPSAGSHGEPDVP